MSFQLRRAGKSRREIKEILGPMSNSTLDAARRGEPPPEWTRRPNATGERTSLDASNADSPGSDLAGIVEQRLLRNVQQHKVIAIRRWVIGSPPAFEAGLCWFESSRRNCFRFTLMIRVFFHSSHRDVVPVNWTSRLLPPGNLWADQADGDACRIGGYRSTHAITLAG